MAASLENFIIVSNARRRGNVLCARRGRGVRVPSYNVALPAMADAAERD